MAKLFRGGKLIYNIQDFNPEQAEAIAYNKSQLINNIARSVDNRSIKRADRVVVVGRDMREKLYHRCPKVNRDKVSVINNWINENDHIGT